MKIKSNKLKFSAVIALALSFLCCVCVGAAGLLSSPANADGVGDTYTYQLTDPQSTRLSNLRGVFGKINGVSTTYNSYADFSAAFGNSHKNAQQINSIIRVGDTGQWQIVYAERAEYTYGNTEKGDIIATVFGITTHAVAAQPLVNYNDWTSADTSLVYPASMYSSSYARSVLTGSSYVASIADAQAGILTAGTQNAVWGEVESNFGKFLAVPANMGYQERESAILQYSAAKNHDNESWGDATNLNTNLGLGSKKGNTDWKYDKLWLSSRSETGGTSDANNGLWNLTDSMRAATGGNAFWQRTISTPCGSAHALSATGGVSTSAVNVSFSIRPAMHLNLRLLYEDATSQIGELYDGASGAVNQSALSELLSAVNSGSGGDYNALKAAVNARGGALDYTQIKANNGGNTLTVTLGGRQWFVPYISKDKTGNLIATLWLAGTSETRPYSDKWISDGSSRLSYPASMYSSSYLRSFLVGSPYSTATGGEKVTDSDGLEYTKVANDGQLALGYAGAQSDLWKNFLESGVADYLVKPKNVGWQEDEAYCIAHGSGTILCPNEELGTPAAGAFVEGMDFTDRYGYYDWGEDYLWIPSLYEAKTDQRNDSAATDKNSGLWAVDSALACPDGIEGAWVRSSNAASSDSGIICTSSGIRYVGRSNYAEGIVRPALHFNLTKAAGGEPAEYSLAELWNEAVQTSLDSGKQVEFILPENWYAVEDAAFGTAFGTGAGFMSGALCVPAGADIKLRLNGRVIDRNLSALRDDGGVIYVYGKLEIVDMAGSQSGKITGGKSNRGGGGVIAANGGEFTLTGGQITGNRAGSGAGVLVTGANSRFIMNGGFISQNTASSGGAGVGVFTQEDGAFVMNGGTILRNASDNAGGGVYSEGGITVNGGVITENSAVYGGGVYLNGKRDSAVCNAQFNGGVISANKAETDAGGVYARLYNVVIDGANFVGNRATYGGALLTEAAKVRFISGRMDDNTAGVSGGAVYTIWYDNDGVQPYSEMTVDGGTFSGNEAQSGGVFHVTTGSTVTVNNGVFTKNSATYGGAFRVAADGTANLIINGGTVSENTAGDGGGAIHVNPSDNLSGNEVLTVNGGTITGNSSRLGGGILLCRNAIASINGGVITRNSAETGGGGVFVTHSVKLSVTGGEITYNRTENESSYGGGIYAQSDAWDGVAGSTEVTFSGGLISHNSAGCGGGGIYLGNASLTVTGGEITYNETRNMLNEGGGGIEVRGTKASVVLEDGLIANNTAGCCGGGLLASSGATFVMNGGKICRNKALENLSNASNPAGGGGGISIWTNCTVTVNDGEISDNEAACYGGGICMMGTGATDTSTVNLNGGRIINNRTTGQRQGGGIAVLCVRSGTEFTGTPNILNVSGGVVAGNTAMDGRVSNVYLGGTTTANRAKINITGALADDKGKTAYIGVSSAFSGVFTANYSAANAGVNALTYFFSDESNYGVAMSGNEAALSSSVDRKTLVWQYRENGGNWTNIESTQFTAEYTGGTFEVQGVYDGRVIINIPTSTSAAGGISGSFTGVGVYTYTLPNAESGGVIFANPTLIFEIIPARITWQIAVTKDIDGNAVTPVWESVQGNALLFTGCEYTVRALSGGREVALDGPGVMLEAKDYAFKTVGAESGVYDGGGLEFKVNARYIGVNWNFDGFTGNAFAGYEKAYDGFGHSPIFTLDNVDNVTVGQLKVHKEYSYAGGAYTAAEPRNAGAYSVRIALDNDSRFLRHLGTSVIFSGESVWFTITPVSLRVEWRNGDGTPITGEPTYKYAAAGQGLSVRLLTPMTGESVNGVVKYYDASGSPLDGEPVKPGSYLARADLPAECVNYVLADNYSQTLTITKATISPKFTGNADNGGAFVWYYNGKAQAPSVTLVGADGIALVAGVDYDISGDDNVNALDYVLSVALRAGASDLYVLEDATRNFTIAKAPVNIEWSGYTAEDGGTTQISGETRADGGIYWTFDGKEHGVTAVAKPVNGLAEFELSLTNGGGLINAGSLTATASLGANAANFDFAASAKRTQKFTVEKFIINNVIWERDGRTYNSGDTPRYAFGTVTSEGPGFTVTAVGAAGDTLSFTDKSFSWLTSGSVYDLPENTVDGYTVTVTLNNSNYVFAPSIACDTDGVKTLIKFFIDPVYAEVTTVEVVWFVLDGNNERVPLSGTPDNKFTFVYDGGEHEIYAWFYDEGGDWATGVPAFPDDKFNVIFTGDKTSAGTHTARVTPEIGFEFNGALECSYEITQKPLTIEWAQDGKYVYGGTSSEIIPHYTVKDGDSVLFVYDGTALPSSGELVEAGFYVTGAFNAGPHDAVAHANGNYKLINGTFGFTIDPYALTGAIKWDNLEIIRTGGVVQPTAKIDTPYDGELVLRVLGGASELGEHTAFAIIDSTGAGHNYVLSASVVNDKIYKIVLKTIDIANVYWTADDNAEGDRITSGEYTFAFGGDGTTAVGKVQGPHAFFTDGGTAYALEVVGHASDAGSYVAFVADGYEFTDGRNKASAPSCPFVIKPKTVTGAWSDLTADYDGSEHKPTFTLTSTGNVLESEQLAKAIEVTGFTNAGEYTASAALSAGYYRTNYVFDDGKGGTCGTLETGYTINKFTLTATHFGWNGTASWTFGDTVTPPSLTAVKAVEIGGVPVAFTFDYTGFSGHAGAHSVTARIAAATLDGEDVSGNFTLGLGAFAYVVNAREVEVEWRWTGADLSGGKPSFAYNGLARGPVAVMKDGNDYITDDSGEEVTLTVHDLGTTVGGYTAKVFAPDDFVFTGGAYSAEADYIITKAEITLVWDKNGGTEIFADDGVTLTGVKWTYDGTAHAPKAFVFDADAADNRGGEVRVTGSSTDAGTFTAYAEGNNENYEIAGGSATLSCTVEAATVYLVWRGNTDGSFDWQYDGGNEFAPSAVLGNRDDATGNITPIIADGDYLFATVTGAMGVVCGEGESYTATAVPDRKNYSFAADAAVTHEFRIVPKILSGDGWEFEWKSEADPVTGGEYAVYNFVYNGKAQSPVPSVALGMIFAVEYYSVADDGTLTRVPENALTDAGRYRVTASPADGNYAVPADMATVEVVISPMEVQAIWSTDPIIYMGATVNQAPAAHYVDADGNEIILLVIVSETNYAEAGKYTATAGFVSPSANYALKTQGLSTEYEISPRKIPVSWDWTGWTDKSAEYDGKPHAPVAKPSMEYAYEADLKGGLTVSSAITSGGNAVSAARDAGAYAITLTLGGSAAKNYELTDDSAGFTITKRALTITAQSATVAYGSPVPSYSATFSGWADGESENSFNLLNGAVKGNWISCAYNRRSQPGDYPVRLNRVWLESTLKNYKLTLGDGVLTVTAVEKTVIWRGDLDDAGAYYSGAEYKPTAVYYANGVTGAPTQLQVVYADYDEATGTYTPKNDPSFSAVKAGTYYVMAVGGDSSTELSNNGLTYEIHKREITVNIRSVRGEEFGSVYKTVTDGVESVRHKFLSWDYGTDVTPVYGDDLGVTLSCSFEYDAHGYAHAGEYKIVGDWNRAQYGSDYEVTFVGDGADGDGNLTCGVYEIVKAKISILKRDDVMSEGDFTYHIGNVAGGRAWYIRLGDYATVDGIEQYLFIGSKGYRGRDNIKVEYSFKAYNMNEVDPSVPLTPEDETNWITERVGLREVGKYFIHYRITIENHETLLGTWRVLILPENEVVRIIFTKPYETEYGKPVPENLAQYLYREGYITFDNIGVDAFNNRVTATVDDGYGGLVDAKTGVGKYTVNFEIDNTGSDIEYHIVCNTLQSLEETNVGAYVIIPKRIFVDWGETSYEYDGTVKAPSFAVTGFITANAYTVTPDMLRFVKEGDGYEYTAFRIHDNGAEVTVIVAARGNFVAVGGHMLRVAVESPNYEIKTPDDEAVVSIVSSSIDPPPVDPTAPDGLPQWLIYVLIGAGCVIGLMFIIIIVLILRKRKAADYDDEGFGDYYE